MYKYWLAFLCAAIPGIAQIKGEILPVGPGQTYATFSEAIQVVVPGDTIRVYAGQYPGGLFFANVQGTASLPITIEANEGDEVIFEGGNNAWQFSDAAFLDISGFIFRHQAGNGVNFDDGGTYATPAHHVRFIHCTFRDMNASGNNDLLKLSGLDSFEIRQCIFLNGAEGGSGIDMVGCHDGVITGCSFENMGSNCIQAKGGTRNIRIEGNLFKNGGQRSLNLGGSTGLPYFRPLDAPYEAADLKVYSNIFMGAVAPIAFVGSVRCEVINNTIYLPEKWVLRILQETVDTTRFPPCGDNIFRNNILFIDNQVSVVCNIGPNTAPETFTFSNNLWYHAENAGWTGPVLPVTDVNNIVGEDPLFKDAPSEDFTPEENSPAIAGGAEVAAPKLDFAGMPFLVPRSIGAFEGGIPVYANDPEKKTFPFELLPNPARGELIVHFSFIPDQASSLRIFTADGNLVLQKNLQDESATGKLRLNISDLPSGYYILSIDHDSLRFSKNFTVVK